MTGVQTCALPIYLAKFREQAMGEAEIFKKMYHEQTFVETKAYTVRVIPDPYAK